MKKVRKIINLILALVMLLSTISPVIFNLSEVFAVNALIQYHGKVTYGSSTVGDFSVNGLQAFCIDHLKSTPGTGTGATTEIYNDTNIAKCLYYGWGGTQQWDGFTNRNMGLVITSLALDYFHNGNNHNIANDFINYVNSVNMPEIVLDFNNRNLTAYSIDNNMQRTQSATVTGSPDYCLTLNLQSGVTLVNETRGTENSGSVNIYGGDTFYLKAPLTVNGTWNSNNINNCKYVFQPILYRTASATTQDLAGGLKVEVDPASYTNLNVEWLKTGNVEIEKTDLEYSDIKISDTTFELKDLNGNIIASQTTDENGFAKFSNILIGDYTIQEVKANDQYIPDNEVIPVAIEPGQTIRKNITNEHKKGNLKIYKVDKDNHKITLGNVEFQLYSHEFEKVIGTYYTDVDGELSIENLRIGNYSLIETKTNKWYNLANDTDVAIEWNQLTEQTIENELTKGQIKIIKVDLEDNEINLEGVKFGVYDKDNNLLETLITNKDGEATTHKYVIRDFEELTLVELETNENYVLNSTPKTIKLQGNQITNVQFDNERIKGKVEITKIDAKDENKKLEGAKFGIYDINNTLLDTLETNSEGKAISQDLYKGKYYIKELESGSIYYVLNEDSFEFEIINHNEIVPVTIKNEPVDITVEVDKRGTVEIKPKEKVNYTFSNIANTSNTYLEEFKWFDYIPTDSIRLEKMTTGTWNQELTYNVYYQTNKSENYVLFKENLSTQENHNLDFTTIDLDDDEYIIETYFDFGKIDVGFRESISPTMQCQSLDILQNEDLFTNHTETIGIYHNITARSNSKWTTIVHVPEEKQETKLPRTGK